MKISTEALPAEYDYKSQPDCTDLDHIPGTFGLPVIGHLPWVLKDLRGLSGALLRQYGAIAKLNIAGSKGIFVANPEVVKDIFFAEPPRLDPKYYQLKKVTIRCR